MEESKPNPLPITAQQALERLRAGGYIKGYSNSYKRVMDANHNPLFNITWGAFDALYEAGLIKLEGLIWTYDHTKTNL